MKKLFLALLPLSFLLLFFTAKSEASHEILFFWGDGCPHCKVVIQQIEEQGLNEVLPIEFFEVYGNRDNNDLLTQKARECDYTDSIGVPFLYLDGACYVGEIDTLAALQSLDPEEYSQTDHAEVLAVETGSGTETSTGAETTIPNFETEDDSEDNEAKFSKDIIVLGVLLGGVAVGFLLFAILTRKS